MTKADRSKPSTIYAIEGADGRAYIGVTVQYVRIRVGMHMFPGQKTHARSIIQTGDYVVRELEHDVPWSERYEHEDTWNLFYRDDGWDVVSVLNRYQFGWKRVDASLTREQRKARSAGRMSKRTSAEQAAASAIANSHKWKCGGCEMVTTAGAMGGHQRRTGHSGKTKVV